MHRGVAKALWRKGKEGKWVRMKGTALSKPADCFNYVNVTSPFSKAAVKLVKELARTKSPGEGGEIRTWDTLMSVSGKGLKVVDQLVELAKKHKLEPRNIRMSRIGAEDIHLDNLMTLRENRWVDSAGLNGLLQATALQASHVCFGANQGRQHTTWVTDTHFYDKLTRVVREGDGRVARVDGYDYEQVARYIRKADLTNIRQVLIPVNLNNTHWIMMRADVKGKQILVMDSLHQLNPTVAVNGMQWLAETFGISAALDILHRRDA
eukprot:CAMPEP_0181292468 /NCGR_PEP_ID=MMETSP1101-20121128/2522_1 /TAXON_ID=46948 /ORGANISM="Rhodomonas abbreviata, Strain Caron Lab Isolate" /LENGTH=264 /DNA_ID=CAMNT_0023396939 /DNA_START=227 /DNA_END=1021 /DNA_ORIENTATION=-